MSKERLLRIENMIQQSIEENQIPGAVVLVARKGKIVWHKGYGYSDVAKKKKLKRDDLFRIASQTKAVTSTAVMMLWEEGKFQLDDPIHKWIPEFKNARILDTFSEKDSSYTTRSAENAITIRHLLTHTSGIGYGVIDNDDRMKKIYQKAGIVDAFTTDDYKIGENIKKLAKLPLHHNPGDAYVYSEGMDVLGYFIEIVSGMPLDQFFEQRIFQPLGMVDTRFYYPNSAAQRLVAIQTKKDDTWVAYEGEGVFDVDFPVKGAKTFFSGGAGLSSTAKDYACFLQMYLNGGEYNGYRLLSRTTIEFMMTNQIGELRGQIGEHYGLAFGLLSEKGFELGGKGSKGSFNWGGAFNTQYFADPKEDLIGIIYKQTRHISGDQTKWKFRQMVGASIDD
ncbi:serine hydrolase domain-containing protein [Membranihabitans marinus]